VKQTELPTILFGNINISKSILMWCGHIVMRICECIRSAGAEVTGTDHNIEKSDHGIVGGYKLLAIHLGQSPHD